MPIDAFAAVGRQLNRQVLNAGIRGSGPILRVCESRFEAINQISDFGCFSRAPSFIETMQDVRLQHAEKKVAQAIVGACHFHKNRHQKAHVLFDVPHQFKRVDD